MIKKRIDNTPFSLVSYVLRSTGLIVSAGCNRPVFYFSDPDEQARSGTSGVGTLIPL